MDEARGVSISLIAFSKYIEVIEMLRGLYRLEPAGSHGVWSLDDYHFLPFAIGASQAEGAQTHHTEKRKVTALHFRLFRRVYIHAMPREVVEY